MGVAQLGAYLQVATPHWPREYEFSSKQLIAYNALCSDDATILFLANLIVILVLAVFVEHIVHVHIDTCFPDFAVIVGI